MQTEDRLLRISEAADKLALTEDWLYRHWASLPFAMKIGKHLRFSLNGIEEYIEERRYARARVQERQNLLD